MNLKSFRIINFRSIVDTGWIPFSPDGVTVLVGQNESGKSSILEALHFALSFSAPSDDDVRIGASLPEVALRINTGKDIEEIFSDADFPQLEKEAFNNYLSQNSHLIDLTITWEMGKDKEGKLGYQPIRSIESKSLASLLESVSEDVKASIILGKSIADSSSDDTEEEEEEHLTVGWLAEQIWRHTPLSILFNEASQNKITTIINAISERLE